MLGMSAAQRLAAGRAIDGLGLPVDHVLVDGPWDFVTARLSTGSPPVATDTASSLRASTSATSPHIAMSSAVGSPGGCAATAGAVGHSPAVTTVVRGDSESLSIAAASVVAKVARDRMMVAASERYPGYWLASNKGYPCQRHMAALAAWGPSAFHRRSWSFMG